MHRSFVRSAAEQRERKVMLAVFKPCSRLACASGFAYGNRVQTAVQSPLRRWGTAHLLSRVLLTFCLSTVVMASDRTVAAEAAIDLRHRVASGSFLRTGDGEWTSPRVQPACSFDELIYSWHLREQGDAFRLYLKVAFAAGDESQWLYAGYWGAVTNLVSHREVPAFDRGVLDMDWLKLKEKANGFQFQVRAAGARPLVAPPALTVITTDHHPSAGAARWHAAAPTPPTPASRVLDVPLRRQMDSRGKRMIDRCQSAALAAAMEYHGKSVPLEQITAHTFDPEYGYPGIWPRVIGAAKEFGFEGRIERFRDWDAVRRALARNEVLLCSMQMKRGECVAPPYPSMGGHIVALCGITDDGRVVVTDSFLGKSGRGYLCQWLQSDFEKVWMDAKGGIAMVIHPPKGVPQRLVEVLPPFPGNRRFPEEDDH
jgi:hypothetical protein